MSKVEVKEFLDLLYKSATNELAMSDYLGEWARIKYASEAFPLAKIELVKYVNKVFRLLKETASINAVNLHHEIAENEIVFADEKMLLSVLQNIVSNAIKHSEEGGKIIITAKRKEDKIVIQNKGYRNGDVGRDTGTAFSPHTASLSSARKENKGAGIGLLLVKEFLEKNGGEIWVESVEGAGSSFYFTLPISKPLDKLENAKTDQVR